MKIRITYDKLHHEWHWLLRGPNGRPICRGINSTTGCAGFASQATVVINAERFIERCIHDELRVIIWNSAGEVLGGQNLY